MPRDSRHITPGIRAYAGANEKLVRVFRRTYAHTSSFFQKMKSTFPSIETIPDLLGILND